MFDTHCHLNFKAFDESVDEVIKDAKNVGVQYITIPGTDITSSQKAIAITEKHTGIFAAVGIHPHHVYETLESKNYNVADKIVEIEGLLNPNVIANGVKQSQNEIAASPTAPRNDREVGKIVAIGEIGLDRHMYQKTKYGKYNINEEFMNLQKEFFVAQLKLAKQYKKSVIVHNREAKKDLLPLLHEHWDSLFEGRMVLHCGEPDSELLQFVKEKKIFWGVDGDITYYKEKADFIPQVPLDQLVLETDSPFLSPEPLKSEKKYPNVPANLSIIAEYIAKLRGEDVDVFKKQTEENGKKLFRL